MIRYTVFSLLLLSISISACNNNSIIDKNVDINNRTWFYEQNPTFSFLINDSKAKYDIYLNIRHTSSYNYSNLSILLNAQGNKLNDTTFQKEIILSEIDGQWLGKSAASLYEINYLAEKNFTFPDTGKYTFSMKQNMKDNPLKDVVDIGIKIIKQ